KAWEQLGFAQEKNAATRPMSKTAARPEGFLFQQPCLWEHLSAWRGSSSEVLHFGCFSFSILEEEATHMEG
ncbi:hypothetical protein VIGAN_08271100, partial [Vigna angularis var. angularis]